MGIPVLILGESGSGKSASLRNFDPEKVGVFNVAGKPLPFRKKLNTVSSVKLADGGTRRVDYGDILTKKGLNLLNGPGNDIVSTTNLSACGCHMILFTTGRGTPLGGTVPTIKIASNDALANKKPHWIDFNAYGFNTDEKAEALLEIIKQVANGKETKNEKYGCREIAIFKDGVTL